MPVLSGLFDWQKGLIWDIGFIAAGDQLPAGPELVHFCPAMVDTGASHTCIWELSRFVLLHSYSVLYFCSLHKGCLNNPVA